MHLPSFETRAGQRRRATCQTLDKSAQALVDTRMHLKSSHVHRDTDRDHACVLAERMNEMCDFDARGTGVNMHGPFLGVAENLRRDHSNNALGAPI